MAQQQLLRDSRKTFLFFVGTVLALLFGASNWSKLTASHQPKKCQPPVFLENDAISDIHRQLLLQPKRIAILIYATGKYLGLGVELIKSGLRFFCKSGCQSVTYILFTDAVTEAKAVLPSFVAGHGNKHEQVIFLNQTPLGWPDDSMKRFHVYLKQERLIKSFDFVMALDADLRFISEINLSEVYGELVGTIHPGFLNTSRFLLPFERFEHLSKAFVPFSFRKACHYYTGAVWGGRSSEFATALHRLVWQIEEDSLKLGANFTPVWHDESHLNRLFVDSRPTRILSPSFYFPEDDESYDNIKQYQKKIVALKKNHQIMRNVGNK